MPFRLQPRDIVLGIVLAVSLLGLVAGSHADAGLWRQSADGREPGGARLLPGGMERIVMRAQSPDHVRAQIERMEARARADERLSGRSGNPSARQNEAQRANERSAQAGNTGNDGRPANVGPGWQGPSRDNNR